MKTKLLSAAVLSIFLLASCTIEQEGPGGELRTTISASVTSTKTALGAKDNSVWPNYWKAGDQIILNGSQSDALGDEADGKSTANFTFDGVLSTPYYAAYPVAAISGYSDGKATVTVPASQSYVEDSYDPAAFVMTGVSSSKGSVSLSPLVSVIHFTLQGSASISSIMLTGAPEAALSGSLSTDFASCEPANVSNEVQLTAATPAALPADFFVCVPAGLSGQVTVDIYDAEGGSMSKEITIKSALQAGKVYSPAAIEYVPESSGFPIRAEGISSSTAIICWDGTPDDAYTVSVYTDKACTTLDHSYAIDAADACWDGKAPRFCVSGLAAGTTYYIRVSNDTAVSESAVLPVRTDDFQIVEVSELPAAEGDVLLAEDFSELRWDSDVVCGGAGWFPTEAAQLASFTSLEVGSYQSSGTSNEKQLSAQVGPIAASRLAHWAQGANKNIYIHPGYLKLVGSSKVTHLVTPAFNSIPEGMEATLEVEVTASAYYSESSGEFATTDAILAVQKGELEELSANATNTLDLESNVTHITLAEELAWHTYKVIVTGVEKGDRLAFGAAKNVTKNNARMNISDIKVTVKAIGEPTPPSLSASFVAASSSTAVFSWTYGGSASYDISRPYRITLATDRIMMNTVVSYDIPANASCWDDKKPSFVFGGLDPNTTYYFMVEDITEGESASSETVSGKTSAFRIVEPATVTNAKAGDVILAEDFSEIGWGSENVVGGAGFVPSEKVLSTPTGNLSTENGSYTPAASTARRLFGDTHLTAQDRLYNWGFFGNSAVYAQAAALRLCTSASGARTSIVSPVLSCIPEGKKATIDVTVTAAMYNDDANDLAVYVGWDPFMELVLAPDQHDDADFSSKGGKFDGISLSDPHVLGITKRAWTTRTVRIEGVVNTDRLIIGTAEDVDTKNRFFLSDVSATIVGLADATSVFEATAVATSSSALAFSWRYPEHPYGAYYDAYRPYRASLYSDEGCNTLVVSHEFEAGASYWSEMSPCFSFGGLDPATPYWLVVEDLGSGKKSAAVSATTEAFTVVDPTTATVSAAGDVLLAEDFSEIGWGPDEFAGAAGFIPSPRNLLPHTGVSPEGVFVAYGNTGQRIFGTGVDLGESRLSKGWGFFGNSSTYLRDAYLRVGASGGRTHMVTPALSGIPEGKMATIEVTVTATKYDAPIELAVFVERGLSLNSTEDASSASYKKYTGASLSDGYALDITTVKEWETKSVTIPYVIGDCQLVIGSLEDNDGKNRFYLSDVTVTVVELADIPVEASVVEKGVSSSTLAFRWGYPTSLFNAAYNISKPYKASLYSDENCTNLVVSHEFEAEASCWDSKHPCFSFGGLAPATTYWFVAEDTENNRKSAAISATTEAFTAVDATTVSNAAVGDVILAEDFSEINWGPDEFAVAAGFVPSPKDLLPHVGASPSGYFNAYDNTGNRIFGTGVDLGDSRLSKGWGFMGNSAAFLRNAHLRVASTSGRTHIVTPALAGIPAGKFATVEVAVTACKMESNSNDVAVFVKKDLSMNSTTDPSSSSYRKYTDVSLTDGHAFGITAVKTWETKTVSISGLDSDHQLVIGSLEDISGKNRFCISDVKVTITELIDDPAYAITDEASLLAFAAEVNGGNKTLDAKVWAPVTVSAAGAEAFQSIEGYEGTFDGKGKSITGLTKSMFNVLEGTVKNLTLNSTLNITEDRQDMGILANIVNGTVTGCTTQGSLTFSYATVINAEAGETGEHRIGGMIGKVAGSGASVSKCTNEASVTNNASSTGEGELIIGGVVGSFWGTEFHISNCSNSGAVTNTAHWNKTPAIGGIMGQGGNSSSASSNFSIASCSNSGAISNSGTTDNSIQIGGIAGYVRFATMTSLSNSGAISNSGTAVSNVCIGGLLGWVDKSCSMTQTKATNNGAVTNYGSGKLVSVGGIIGRNSSGNITATGTSSDYLQNNGTISDASSISGDDLSIGGIVGYTTTGIKLQYARNYGDVQILGGTRDADVEIGGVAGFLDNNALNVNNCRNYGEVKVTATITGDLFAGGIVGLYNYKHTTDKYNLVFDATIDTHEATVTGENWTAGLFGAHTGTSKATYLFNGLKFNGTVIGNKTKTGLLCNSRNATTAVTFKGSCLIAPGSSRQYDDHNDVVNTDDDLTMDVICGYLGSTSSVSGVSVEEW